MQKRWLWSQGTTYDSPAGFGAGSFHLNFGGMKAQEVSKSLIRFGVLDSIEQLRRWNDGMVLVLSKLWPSWLVLLRPLAISPVNSQDYWAGPSSSSKHLAPSIYVQICVSCMPEIKKKYWAHNNLISLFEDTFIYLMIESEPDSGNLLPRPTQLLFPIPHHSSLPWFYCSWLYHFQSHFLGSWIIVWCHF